MALKVYGGTDKLSHGYGVFYARHLRRFRVRSFTLLEIGIFHGDSLRVWRDVFPWARIVGLDLHIPSIRLGRRVRLVQGDQAEADDLRSAIAGLPALAVVIDDGSHRGDDIWASFTTLFPLLQSGGVYIVEDLSTSYWPEFGGGVPAPDGSAVGLARVLVDAVMAQARAHEFTADRTIRPVPPRAFEDVASIYVVPNAIVVTKV